jgi:predicted nuclease of predicted toxin-antitoxin system
MWDALAAQGHDGLSALERNPRAADEELLAPAMEERRILVTEDKDFGELVFMRRLPRPCIVRFVGMTVAEKVAAMRELIEQTTCGPMREGSLIVMTHRRVRMRQGERAEGGGA